MGAVDLDDDQCADEISTGEPVILVLPPTLAMPVAAGWAAPAYAGAGPPRPPPGSAHASVTSRA
ncbi:hypothetical protein [Parafrankia sp. FMc2]|uniref:hypothetical protein n=1 Tax=Parafrankia sp. FMc2 TaxID=3233196 RepID=UPI0034D7501E